MLNSWGHVLVWVMFLSMGAILYVVGKSMLEAEMQEDNQGNNQEDNQEEE